MPLQSIDCCMDLIFGILAKSVLFFNALKRRLKTAFIIQKDSMLIYGPFTRHHFQPKT